MSTSTKYLLSNISNKFYVKDIHAPVNRMYYIGLLLYDSIIVTLQFNHGFSTKCIGYYTMYTGAYRIWLRNCTNTVRCNQYTSYNRD